MGIKKITQLASNVLLKIQKMPLPKQLGLAALATTSVFGLGVVAGQALFGDRFEKELVETETKLTNKEHVISNDNKETKQKFEYTPPIVGENGIVAADTLYSPKTQKIAAIYYNDSNNLTHHYANYDDNGDLKDFTICYENGNETTYNKNGEETSSLFYNNDGGYIYRFDNEHSSGMIERDKEGRIITRRDTWKKPWSWTAVDYEYNSKGERIEKIINKDNEKNKHNYYDKNDRLTKSKQFDDTNQLLYTITPKYDQDGDLIKRDTIWVNK